MKKFCKLLILVLTLGLLMTGCKMKEEIGFSIDNGKKLAFRFVYAMDNEMIDAMIKSNSSEEENEATEGEETTGTTETEITDEMRWEYLKKSVQEDYGEGFTYEKYETDDYKGYIVTKTLGNLDDFVTTEESEKVTITDDVSNKKIFVKNSDTYKSLMKLDTENSGMSGISQYEAMGALFDIKFTVTLPNKSISNNATTVSEDGLTLTWDLLKLTDGNIDFEFKVDNFVPSKTDNVVDNNKTSSSNIMVYIGIGGLLLLIVLIILIVISKKKENNNEFKPYDNTPSNNKFLSAIHDNDLTNEEKNVNEYVTENEPVISTDIESDNHYEEPNALTEESNTYKESNALTEESNVEGVNNDLNSFNVNETNDIQKETDDVIKVEPFDEN